MHDYIHTLYILYIHTTYCTYILTYLSSICTAAMQTSKFYASTCAYCGSASCGAILDVSATILYIHTYMNISNYPTLIEPVPRRASIH